MAKHLNKTKWTLGILAAIFVAAEPLMPLWQPLLPAGSYAGIATIIMLARAALTFMISSPTAPQEESQDDADPQS
jgi:purine-cytosine permease-like protein